MGQRLQGYIRVSAVAGRAGDRFHSPTDQAKEIQAWAAKHGHTIDLLPPELDGKGNNPNRPILKQAVHNLQAGTHTGVVVAYLSRAGRDLRLILDLTDTIEQAGGSVYYARENIDATTPSGRLQRNILASIAQHELEERREGFQRARANATSQGIWQNPRAPYGYTRNPQTRRLEPNQDAERVRELYARRAAGEGFTRLAADYPLTPSGMNYLIKSRVYRGELRVGKHHNPAAHPPIVTEDEWLAANHVRGVLLPPRSGTVTRALLAGIVRCGSCGHVMPRGSSSAPVYGCRSNHSLGPCPKPASITIHRLDEHVMRVADHAIATLNIRAESRTDNALLQAARSRETAAARDVQTYLAVVGAAGLDAARAAEQLKVLMDKHEQARDHLANLLNQHHNTIDTAGLAEAWPAMDDEARSVVLRGLVEAVVVWPTRRGYRIPAADRSQVIAHGSGIVQPYGGAGRPLPIRAIPRLDEDDPRLLGLPVTE